MNRLTAEKLRKSILQLAIQGKLVKQDPNDEPASELVKKIYAERQKLIADGKIKKEKEESFIFKGDDNHYYEKKGKETVDISADLPFDIPDTWIWMRLGNVGDWGAGVTPNRSNSSYYGGKIPWVKTGELNNAYINNSSEHITEKALNECSIRLNKPGDILVAMYGATIGKLGIAKVELTTNQACCACSCYPGVYNLYLFNYLKAIKDELIKQGSGGAQPNISREKIVSNLLPLPPLAEQERIVEKINSLEPMLEKYDELEKTLNKLESEFKDKVKKSILQYAIQGKLVKQDPNDEPVEKLLDDIKTEKEKLIKSGKIKRDKSESYIYHDDDKNFYEKINSTINLITDYLYELPANWRWCSLSNISKMITDGTHKTPQYVSKGVPFLSVQNISSGKFNLSNLKYITLEEHNNLIKRCKPEKGDILICRIGTLGKPIIVTLNFEFSIFVSLGLIKIMNQSLTSFIKIVLESPFSYNHIDRIKVGGGTHTFKINIEDLSKFPVPLPPLAEQHRIVNKIEELFKIIG